MKNYIFGLTRAYINDNKEYIDGNIAAHLADNTEYGEYGFYFYLSDDEIEEYETDIDMRNHYKEGIIRFIWDNFDYDISKFEY